MQDEALSGAYTDIVGGATLECPSAKLDREIFENRPSAKIGSFENLRLEIFEGSNFCGLIAEKLETIFNHSVKGAE